MLINTNLYFLLITDPYEKEHKQIRLLFEAVPDDYSVDLDGNISDDSDFDQGEIIKTVDIDSS